MKIAIGADHAGFEYKVSIVNFLKEKGCKIKDFGTFSSDSTDYPDFSHPLSRSISEKSCCFGILICGTGNGVAMVANKYVNVRAALCWNKELAILARKHNHANILCLPARFISLKDALQLTEIFINSLFEGGRHKRRIDKINII